LDEVRIVAGSKRGHPGISARLISGLSGNNMLIFSHLA
jgi:hypothetical protein